MKTTIGILVAAVIILGGAIGVIVYQKSVFDARLEPLRMEVQATQQRAAQLEAENQELRDDLATARQDLAETQARLEEAQSPTMPVLVGENAIFVSDHQPGMETVTAGFVVLADAGFVAVHREDEDNDAPGVIVGNSVLLPEGRTDNVFITLTEPLEEGSYWAMLHNDDGDGDFNPADDGSVRNDDGNVIMMRFEVFEGAQGSEAQL